MLQMKPEDQRRDWTREQIMQAALEAYDEWLATQEQFAQENEYDEREDH